MKKYQFLIIIYLILYTSLSSCRTIKNVEYRNLEILKLEKLNLNNSILNVSLSCYNPNRFAIELLNSKFDIYINDKLCGSSLQTDKVKINKISTFNTPITIDINLKKTLANLGLGLLNQEFKITVKGEVRLKKGILTKNMPVTYTTSQKLNFF